MGFLLGFGSAYLILEPMAISIWIVLVISGGVGFIFAFLMTFVVQIGIFAMGAILGLALSTVVFGYACG